MPATGVVHYDSLVGVQATIQEIGLTGISGPTSGLSGVAAWTVNDPLPDSQVILGLLPDDESQAIPAVFVSEAPLAETEEPGTTGEDDWGYPCLVSIVLGKNRSFAVDQTALRWRQQIKKTFHNKKPASMISALNVKLKKCLWQPMPVFSLTLWQKANLWVSAAVVRVFTREGRS